MAGIDACLTQAVFPYEKDKYGDIINTQDSPEKIVKNVYHFFSKVSQVDKKLMTSLKSGIIESINKLEDPERLSRTPRAKL